MAAEAANSNERVLNLNKFRIREERAALGLPALTKLICVTSVAPR